MKFFTALKDRLLRKQRQAQALGDISAIDEKLKDVAKRQHRIRNRNAVLMFEAYGENPPRKK